MAFAALDEFLEFTSIATRDTFGAALSNTSTIFGLMSELRFESPVVLPPGRPRLATNPLLAAWFAEAGRGLDDGCCQRSRDHAQRRLLRISSHFGQPVPWPCEMPEWRCFAQFQGAAVAPAVGWEPSKRKNPVPPSHLAQVTNGNHAPRTSSNVYLRKCRLIAVDHCLVTGE